MNDYYEVRVDLVPCIEDATDLLASLLGDVGYESFIPDEKGLTAYVKADLYSAEAVESVIAEFPFDCKVDWHSELIVGKDWNEEWEKNYFKPIIVERGGLPGVVIHSSFHTDVPKAEYEIVIDPKMAFGTGHHATTSQIIQQLLEMPLSGKSVIDMGTGTGILALLAAMRGAKPVVGIEIDAFAYENAKENVNLNGHSEIELINGDASSLATIEPADIFIANINRNIIINDLDRYVAALKPGGKMLLSGFYEHDIPVVCYAAEELGMQFEGATSIASCDGNASVKIIMERPSADGFVEDVSPCKAGTFGAVNTAEPGYSWACLILVKKK